MTTRRTVIVLAALAAALAGCSKAAPPGAGGGNVAGPGGAGATATTAAPATTAPPAGTTPPLAGGTDYCGVVIAENTKWGTLKDGKFSSMGAWTPAQLHGLIGDALAGRDQFIALAPPEIRDAVRMEMDFFQAVADNGYRVAGTPIPAGFPQAAIAITDYQHQHCGL